MKKLVLFIALFAQTLLAQPGDLAINLQPVRDSAVNWEATLTLEAQNGMENGLLIELPAGVKMVPLSARLNETELFLQNLDQAPASESVVNWDLTDEGVVLFFAEGQYSPGDRLILKTMTTQIKKQIEDNQQINIRTVLNTGPDIQYSEDIKVSNVLSLRIEN